MPLLHNRFRGVTVSTQDSESCDPSSNLGGTWHTFFVFRLSNVAAGLEEKDALKI